MAVTPHSLVAQFPLRPGEPETRLEAGDVIVVLGEPDALEVAEIRLLLA